MALRVGFVGLGLMGHGMAKNLVGKGFAVTAVAHRNRAPLEDLLSHGVAEARTPSEAAAATDVLIICVTGSPEVEAVVYGPEGVLEGAKEGLIVIDCTTSEPASAERMRLELEARGAALADAPLARTPADAEAGRLNAMVGASADVFETIEPVLRAFCENIFHVGGFGAGHKTKLIYNFLTMGQAAMIAEALCACAATGVDLGRFSEVVSAGGANSGIFQLIVPKALEGDLTGLQFSLANAEKDLRYYTHLTEAVPLAGHLGGAVHQALVQGRKLSTDGFVGDLIAAQEALNQVAILERREADRSPRKGAA